MGKMGLPIDAGEFRSNKGKREKEITDQNFIKKKKT